MKRTWAYGAATTQGNWPVQEDGFLADPQRGRFAVADGFGGRGAGDMAAKAALLGLRGAGESSDPKELRESFRRAHRDIRARNETRPPTGRGGASLVAAWFVPVGVAVAQAGGCAALLLRGGRCRPLLLPQAPPREDFQPLLPNEALGLGEEIGPELRVLALEAGDVLALVSSGVDWESDAFSAALLAQLALRELGESLEAVAMAALDAAGVSAQGWNRTVVLVEKLL